MTAPRPARTMVSLSLTAVLTPVLAPDGGAGVRFGDVPADHLPKMRSSRRGGRLRPAVGDAARVTHNRNTGQGRPQAESA